MIRCAATVSLQFGLLLLYSAGLTALGLFVGRRVKGTSDFFVAGRSLGPGLLAATLLAANIGAGSTVGAAGLGYRDGLAAWWWVGSAALGSVALALWVGPRIWRVAAQHDLRTVGDYLELRYNATVRVLMAVLLWLGSLAILAGQLIALAWILNVVAGVPKPLGCLVGGALVSAYFSAGGLLTSAWVNLVQLIVKLVGFALALPLALAAAGGLSKIAALESQTPTYLDFWSSGSSGVIFVALLAPAFVVSPGLVQKAYGARDERAVRLGVGLNALGLLAYAIVPVLMGMSARALFPALPSPELALPSLLTHALPPAIGTLGLAAVFSAEVSTADAVLFMLTTSLAQDLYKRLVAPGASDRAVLRVTRITAFVAGSLATVLAVVSPSVIGVLSIFYTLLGVSLFVPLVAGLFTTRVNATDALAAMIGGVVAALTVQVSGRSGGFFTPPVVGLGVATAACLISVFVRRFGRSS
jgi:SSS family solute:Na+ symporter